MKMTLRTLYMILALAVLSACGGTPETPTAAVAQPTFPPEWLTKPPTPVLTPSAPADGAEAESAASLPPADGQADGPVADAQPTPTLAVSITLPPTPAVTAVPRTTAAPTPVSAPTGAFDGQVILSAAPGVPAELVALAQQLAAARPNDFVWANPGEAAPDVTLVVGEGIPLTQWIYAVVAPFATIPDDVSLADVQGVWSGSAPSEGPLVDAGFVVDEATAAAYSLRWGDPAGGVQRVAPESVVETLWAQRPAFGLLPFHQLTPDLKVMAVDGASPVARDFSTDGYPLLLDVGLTGEETAVARLLEALQLPTTNRDLTQLTQVAMTGVTALVRATASQMEIDGILSPASDVGPILREADISHISNEVAFAPDCPEPNPIGGTTFCSQVDYFELLEDLGTDVVELTGNHVNDWGRDNLVFTLELYDGAGMQYFGGGRNEAEAAEALTLEHNGNRIAFVGCNPVGPPYAWATQESAGSRACGPEFEEQIAQLAADGYLVIATLQYYEFYQYDATGPQKEAFRALVDAGATAVSGSQGHHAQGFDLYQGGFIHYGLGNLFFDQMDMLGTRQAFVDRYTIYDGRLLNVGLWTGLIEDFSRPRTTTVEERQQALEAVFRASGW